MKDVGETTLNYIRNVAAEHGQCDITRTHIHSKFHSAVTKIMSTGGAVNLHTPTGN